MKPLHELTAADVAPLAGVLFDLDDTLLDHGHLREVAYGSLFRLREAGFKLIGCTGRPYGWIELLSRQWPVDAMIAENGAAAILRTNTGELRPMIAPNVGQRSELLRLAEEILRRFPAAAITTDNKDRVADVTIDIGETCRVPFADVLEMHAIARAAGVASVSSSVHFHLAHEAPDKAAGAVRLLVKSFGEDATTARRRYTFIGDSGNDATAFAAFKLTFGVANVVSSAPLITRLPRFVSSAPMGRGFAQIGANIVKLKAAA